ncbi:MAG TPA: hypothetical protein VJ945_05200, partial [Flavobacteriaceae bacterium]|nr:hypothetical protein [Flavobacteriaceae bacterium]
MASVSHQRFKKDINNNMLDVNAFEIFGQRLLNVHFKLPFKKIQLLFGDLFGYRINESTVYSASEQ